MKKPLSLKFLISSIALVAFFSTAVLAAAPGTIDPANEGKYKAAFLDSSVVSDTAINFGKFTTQSAYNITVSDTELRGYAWGASVGYIVTNCADTTSGCSSTNGNFKIANNGGNLSGYAWGENTGWINFGPFTDAGISTVKIGTDGNFGGTLGGAGYAWSQNYGWIVFNCSSLNTCVHTDWGTTTTTPPPFVPPANGGGILSGGGPIPPEYGGPTPGTPTTPTTPTVPTTPTQPGTTPTTPSQPTIPGSNNGNPDQPTTPPGGSNGGTPGIPPSGSSGQPTIPAPTNNEPGMFSGGLQLPPALTESLGSIFDTITRSIDTIRGGLESIVSEGTRMLQTPEGKTAAGWGSFFGLIIAMIGALALLLLSNPSFFSDLPLLIARLWSWLLIIFGLRKHARPWGTVYDSVTKQPIDPAYVILTDLQGNEVATSITDIDGRYGFSVPPGMYKIVANKTNYEFPSKKLAGRDADELYLNLYFGETVEVKEEGDIINKNIPLDQLNFDWNEFAKNEQKRLSYYRHSDIAIARIANVFFWLGFALAAVSLLSVQSLYNEIIFGIYVLMLIVRHYSPQFKQKGAVNDAMTGQPMPFAIVHLISAATGQEVAHKVANRLGYYYGLVPNGTYTVVIDRKNPDASYTKLPVPGTVTVDNGYLEESFTV
ncbi:MAG: carboxypeptidase regulatory-like domain-containing protein [Patescibacteria group bacterium]